MKMKFHLTQFVSFIVFLTAFNASSVFATHVENMELFYRWKSDSTYEFTAVFLRNCNGFVAGGPPQNFSISARSSSLGINQSFLVSGLPMFGTGIPPLMPANIYNCVDSFNIPCHEEYVYRGDWTSSGKANDWVFSTNLCCRPNIPAPANLINGSIWIEIGLNNLDFPDTDARNSSPFWHNRRPNHPGHLQDTVINYWTRTVGEGEYNSIDQSVREYQGDSIHYSFYNPQTNNGYPNPYLMGFTFANPMPTLNGPLTINPITGNINLVAGQPNGSGLYVIGLQAEEFRNDTVVYGNNLTVVPKRIGYVRREFQIWIIDSLHWRKDSAHIKDIFLYNIPADSTITVSFHDGIPGHQNSLIRCNTLSPDGSEFMIVDSSNYVHPYDSTLKKIPVISAQWRCEMNGMTDKVHLKLAENLTCGNYSIVLRIGTDLDVIESECGYWEPAGSSGEILFDHDISVNIGPDREVCDNAFFYEVISAGLGYESYYWNTFDTSSSILVSYAREYWVEVSNKFECVASDTMEVIAINCDTINNDTTISDTNQVGINSYNRSKYLLFPNPSNGQVFIQGNDISQEYEVMVYDLRGMKMLTRQIDPTNEKMAIDLGRLNAGIYLVQIIEEGQIIQQEKVILSPN